MIDVISLISNTPIEDIELWIDGYLTLPTKT